MTSTAKSVTALYTEQPVFEYQGNPFIEALPPILSPNEAVLALTCRPYFDKNEKKLDAHYRIHCVPRIFQYFFPLQKHLDLERDIGIVMRQAYCSRNPLGAEYIKRARDGHRQITNGKYEMNDEPLIPSLGFSILGISGAGKSRSLLEIMGLYPSVIEHTEYNGQAILFMQIPLLKVDCPHDGSTLKGLCKNFYTAVDKMLKGSCCPSNYEEKYGDRRDNKETMLGRMEQITNNHGIGVLLIDEIQYLAKAKGDDARTILNFFVSMVNKLNIPILFVGNFEAANVLSRQFKMAKRGTGLGTSEWNRLRKDVEVEWEDFEDFIHGMWEFQWTRDHAEITDEFIEVMYDQTQGILDLVVKLFVISQIRAISSGEEVLTPELIKRTAAANFKPMKEILEALREGNEDLLVKYDDVLPLDIQDFINSNLPKFDRRERARLLKEKMAEQRKENHGALQDQIVHRLRLFDERISFHEAEKCAKETIERLSQYNEPFDLNAAVKEAAQLAWERAEVNQGEKQQAKEPPSKKAKGTQSKKKKTVQEEDLSVLEKAGYLDDSLLTGM